jgi:hypothetical protein
VVVEFLKQDPRWRREPLPKRAGWAAREVVWFLFQVCGEFDKRGRLPSEMTDPEWLASEWLTSRTDDVEIGTLFAVSFPEFIRRGIEAGIREGLLLRDGADLVLVEWDRMYAPRAKTDAERAKEYRDRKKGAPPEVVTSVTPPVTPPDSSRRHDTPLHSTPQHKEDDHLPTNGFALTSPETPVSKAPRKSKAIRFFESAQAERRRRNPTIAPDDAWTAPRINKQLGECVEVLGVDGAFAAYGRYLDNPRAGGLKQGWPMWAFVTDWRGYAAETKTAAAPTRPSLEVVREEEELYPDPGVSP